MHPARLALWTLCLACGILSGCNASAPAWLRAPAGPPAHVGDQRIRALQDENRAMAAQLRRFEAHDRELGDQLRQAETRLADLDRNNTQQRRRLVAFAQPGPSDNSATTAATTGPEVVAADPQHRLSRLALAQPQWRFDPITGVAKWQRDLPFVEGETALSGDADRPLVELAQWLTQPAQLDLKLLVAGHADGRLSVEPNRQGFGSNWLLSAARASAVVQRLKDLGVSESRLAVSAFAHHQPLAASDTPENQQRNRRVELFLVPPESQLIGWPETTPSLYP